MASYLVTSSNFAPAPEGATVDDEQLGGCDIPALVAGGHLTPVDSTAPPTDPGVQGDVPPDPQDPAVSAPAPKE